MAFNILSKYLNSGVTFCSKNKNHHVATFCVYFFLLIFIYFVFLEKIFSYRTFIILHYYILLLIKNIQLYIKNKNASIYIFLEYLGFLGVLNCFT